MDVQWGTGSSVRPIKQQTRSCPMPIAGQGTSVRGTTAWEVTAPMAGTRPKFAGIGDNLRELPFPWVTVNFRYATDRCF